MPANKRQRVGSPSSKNAAIDGHRSGHESNEQVQLGDDLDTTPRAAGSSGALHSSMSEFTNAMHQLLPPFGDIAQGLGHPISNFSASSPERESTTSGERSASPVKIVRNLELLPEMPVQWDATENAVDCLQKFMELCPDQVGIVSRLATIAAGMTPCIPAELKRELEPCELFHCLDSAFTADSADAFDAAGGCDSEDDNTNPNAAFQLLYELEVLREIVESTALCRADGSSEPAWKDEVHSPLLRLAVKKLGHVRAVNISRATIDQAFLPSATRLSSSLSAGTRDFATSTTDSSGMVDYALILRYPPSHPLRCHIAGFLSSQCGQAWNPMTINPTLYPGLELAPAGVLIETKSDSGTAMLGCTQLGLSIRAWFTRFQSLSPCSPLQSPILPIILVMSDTWECCFACQVQGGIRIIGSLCLGSTRQLAGAYRILAALRELGRWLIQDFGAWIKILVGYQESDQWTGCQHADLAGHQTY